MIKYSFIKQSLSINKYVMFLIVLVFAVICENICDGILENKLLISFKFYVK